MTKQSRILFWLSFIAMLAAIVPIMPTFDAWTTTSAPNPCPLEWQELLPQGEYWRPWDVLYSHFIGRHPSFFPILNHLFIGIVHILNCFLVYNIARRLDFNHKISKAAFVYSYICPAMLGVVLDVDSIHQVAALAWGLLSLLVYLISINSPQKNNNRYFWLVFVIIGTFVKESCFAFMLITPFTAWGFRKISAKMFWKDMVWAVIVGLAYLVARLSLSKGEIASDYVDISLMQLVKNFGIFVLFHLPIGIPLLFCLKRLSERPLQILVCSIIFASILHLGSVYATMHTYVSLPFAALIFAILIDKMKWKKALCITGIALSLVIDIYLTKTTYDSGELGRRLAQQAIDNTPEPADSVYTISVAAGRKGFSTFIVRDYNAFAWGIFSRYLNNFEWPTVLKDTTINEYPDKAMLNDIINKGRAEGFSTFWIVRNDSVEVIR